MLFYSEVIISVIAAKKQSGLLGKPKATTIRFLSQTWPKSIAFILFSVLISQIAYVQAQDSENAIEFPLRPGERLDPVHPKYCDFGSEKGIMYIDYANKELVFRSFSDTIDSVVRDIGFYPYQFVQNYLLLDNGDGIFAMNANYFLGNHNKSLLKYSRDKVLLDTIDASIPKLEKYRESRPRDSVYFSVYTYSSIIFNKVDSSTYVPITPYSEFFESKNDEDLVVFAKVFFAKKGIKPQAIKIKNFWSSSDSTLFPMDVKYPRTLETEKYIYVGFGHTPDLYRFNKKTNRYKHIKVRTQLLELYPYKKGDYSSDRYGPILNFKNIYYDENKNCFIRTVVLPVNQDDNPLYKNYRSTLIQKIKPNGRVIDEVELPFGFTHEMLMIENEYYFYNRYESEKKKSLVFSRYNTKSEFNEQDLVSETGIMTYIQKLTQSDAEGTFLIIPLDNSCSSCLQKFEKFIEAHPEFLYNDEIKIVFITQYEDRLNSFLSNAGIGDAKSPNWYIDFTNDLKKYEALWINPRLIQSKNSSISLDEIYNPSEMKNLFSTLLLYCD